MIYLQLLLTFSFIGLFSFGGGYAMIPLIQKEIVTVHGWLTLEQFTDIIAVSQSTPGPWPLMPQPMLVTNCRSSRGNHRNSWPNVTCFYPDYQFS